MSRFVLSYPFTGEDKAAVGQLLDTARFALESQGVRVENLALDFELTTQAASVPRAAMEAAFAMIAEADGLLVLQTSPRRSEGMLMEVGYALAKGRTVVVAAHESAQPSYLSDMAGAAFTWKTYDDLAEGLKQIKWNEFHG